jgi:hypothetical protein
MKKKVIVGIILAPIILVALIIIQYLATNFLISSQPFSATKGLIKANPVNLLQIDSISKFRSCQGHDLSGYNSKGELESNRSMKHYLNPATEFRSTKGKVEVYAPFDGIITGNFSGFRSAEVYIKSHDTNWVVLFYHIELLKALDTGGTVTAGQLIGYADVSDQSNFDISMQRNQDNTIFDFITAKVIKFGYPPFFNQYETMFLLNIALEGLILINLFIRKSIVIINLVILTTRDSSTMTIGFLPQTTNHNEIRCIHTAM